ncbi:MAG: hypothetical protein N2315_02665 [Thermanaerothrix sp.]|nr:hypothetical protein [Thermanaerothrix sp.]
MSNARPFHPEGAVILTAGTVAATAGILGLLWSPIAIYQKGFLGLMTFMFGLESTAIGRSPIGESGPGPLRLSFGMALMLLGMLTSFLPDTPEYWSAWVLALCFCAVGTAQGAEMAISKDKMRAWRAQGGMLKRLPAMCGTAYLLSFMLGLAIILAATGRLSEKSVWSITLAYGASMYALGIMLIRIRESYGTDAPWTSLRIMPMGKAMMLVTGTFMAVLGITLIPVSFGMIRFSSDAQMGLLLIIMSVQVMSTGSTPLGMSISSAAGIPLGIVMAALGTASSLVPGRLINLLTLLIAILNLAGGALGLKSLTRSKKETLAAISNMGRARTPSPLVNLWRVQLAMNGTSILFGASMLIRNLIPGWLVGMILTANGGLLVIMIGILDEVQRLKDNPSAPE